MSPAPRQQLADELLRRFAAAIRSAQLYSAGHPIITRNLEGLSLAVGLLHASSAAIVIGVVGDEIVVDEAPIANAEMLQTLVRRLQRCGVERVTIDRGVTKDELGEFVQAITTMEPAAGGEAAAFPTLTHIRVGRVTVDQRVEAHMADMAALRRMYNESVTVAQTVWESAQNEGAPDATVARTMIDGLAQAVAQNRTALLALTTLKNYDNYTFTHMVNVSILTMGQARGLGIDGALLREFGMAALMHDIGKVKTPLEILNKPDKLTADEFTIMKRHVVDGAEILRATPDMPTLAPVVAFEHHLRLDGNGYPPVKRSSLNLGTMLAGIADVYDAMRSQRVYQKASPTDRILEVLRKNDGAHFEKHLVRRFVQLLGIYPAGNLVKVDTGEAAVVIKVHAPDPYRPQVRIAVDRHGKRLDLTYDVNLWENDPKSGKPSAVVAPLDPTEYQIDPLSLM